MQQQAVFFHCRYFLSDENLKLQCSQLVGSVGDEILQSNISALLGPDTSCAVITVSNKRPKAAFILLSPGLPTTKI